MSFVIIKDSISLEVREREVSATKSHQLIVSIFYSFILKEEIESVEMIELADYVKKNAFLVQNLLATNVTREKGFVACWMMLMGLQALLASNVKST